jgi:hypothetical protein
LPDGLSGIFFARDLDRANQLDAAGEFSFEAQRLRGLQRHASEPPEAGIDPPIEPDMLQISGPPNRISQIIQGKRAITGDTALRLGHWFQTSAILAQSSIRLRGRGHIVPVTDGDGTSYNA